MLVKSLRGQACDIAILIGQLVRVDEPDGSGSTGSLGSLTAPNQPTVYAYDALNNLLSVQQTGDAAEECGGAPNCSQTRSFVYDSLSRLKSATNPESGLIQYGYDNNGNLTSKVDARNITTSYVYDALNRVTNRNYTNEPSGSETPDVGYFYDNLPNAKGKLIKVTNGTGANSSTTEYTAFDILGRVTGHKQTTDGVDYATGYVYNLSGALIEETYPSGRKVRNTFGADGDLMQVQSRKADDTFRNYANAFTYNAAGAVTGMRLGNGKWETTQFNSRLQPTQIGLGSSASSQNLLKLSYTYNTSGNADNNGNVLSQTITVPTVGANQGFTATQTYTYDSLNRLNDAKEMIGTTETWKQTFVYDRYGNRTFDTTLNRTTTIPTGCPTAVCNPSASALDNKLVGYQFDAAGNLIADAEGRTFVYDAEDRQLQVNSGEAVMGQYFYDPDGKRIKKIVTASGEAIVFVYDISSKLIAEYSTVVTEPDEANAIYLTNDHLDSPRILTDATGVLVSRRDFMPFGEEFIRAAYGTDTVRKQFTGYERDAETGMDFAQARMYVNKLARFSVPDPILSSAKEGIPQSWNRYAYCLNNPYKYVDPSGLIWVYQDSEDGKTRTFRWYDNEKDVPKGWNSYTGSNYFIGKDEGIFLGAKGKWEKVSIEEAGLGQLDEFLRGPDSPLSSQDKAKLTRAFTDRVRSFHWEDDFIASLVGTALGSLADRGLRGLAALFTSTATRIETAELAGMLRQAMAGKGDFGIGKATVDQANAMGRAWVGEGAQWSSSGKALVSADGLRQFRPPSYKPDLGKVQANFEWRPSGLKQWQGNGHLDIK